MSVKVIARAPSNIALIKYWGKADIQRNLPAVPSLSLTLDGLHTETSAEPISATDDVVHLDGAPAPESAARRVTAVLDRLRALAQDATRLRIETHNNFPTASGLASSASGFAALVVAASRALGLSLSAEQCSDLAREGSASAARSLYGGFVALPLGAASAHAVLPPEAWDLHLLVAVTASGPKPIGSTSAMLTTQETSAYYPAWVQAAPSLFERGLAALQARDLAALGAAMEESTLLMHATMMTARPPVLYFNGTTLEVIHAVRALREHTPCYFTMDAGPHVKVLTTGAASAAVAATLAAVPGVKKVIDARPGPGAHVVEAASSPSFGNVSP